VSEPNNNEIKEPIDSNSSVEAEPIEEQKETEIKTETKEVKRLEEKEHYELEYFNKEDLISKNKSLDKQVTELKEKSEKLQKESSVSKNKYMHLQAEFENAQKRWNKNRQNLRIDYTASVLKNFLPLYDSFKKALEDAEESEKKVLNNFYNQFMNVYKSYGAEPIEVKVNDPFDYTKHEALSSLEKEDPPENSVIEIIQDGFKYGKEIIRYAKVIVSRKPKPPEPEPMPESKLEIGEEKSKEDDVKEKGGPIDELSNKEDQTEPDKREKKKTKEKKDKKHKKHKKQTKEKDKENSLF